jgi:hypothetical protein
MAKAPLFEGGDMNLISKALIAAFVILIIGANILSYAYYFMGIPGCNATSGTISFVMNG